MSTKGITSARNDMADQEKSSKPLVSLVVPAYNEENIIEQNLSEICQYMESLKNEYRWELIVVDDGSTDGTGELAEAFAKDKDNVHILHHTYNFRLGQALRYAFKHCRGDYVVTLDADLSYSPEHIERMLTTLRETMAKIVVASPYMKGGKVSNVPWMREQLSRWANRFLSLTVTKDDLVKHLSTLTGLARAYDRKFLERLDLRAMDMDIHPEILYKSMILRARIVEIPAHLKWKPTKMAGGERQRKSSLRIIRAIISSFISGFTFRPFMFFIFGGILLLLLSLYGFTWSCIHTVISLQSIPETFGPFNDRLSEAIATALRRSPQSFFIGGLSLMVAIQLISLGIVSLQSKKYFEELFHLGSTIYTNLTDTVKEGDGSDGFDLP
jgi:glycosyltransferase involved in cell wall biosynthesis